MSSIGGSLAVIVSTFTGLLIKAESRPEMASLEALESLAKTALKTGS
jgi:hypothetical protein